MWQNNVMYKYLEKCSAFNANVILRCARLWGDGEIAIRWWTEERWTGWRRCATIWTRIWWRSWSRRASWWHCCTDGGGSASYDTIKWLLIGLVQNPRFVGRNAGKNGSDFVHSTASIKRKETDHSVVLNQRHSAVKLTRSVIRFIHPILLDTTVESSVFYIQFTVSSADHQIGIILSDIRSAIARNWHRFVLS